MSVVDRTSSEFKAFLELYQRAPLLELGQLADAERWRHHPDPRRHLHRRPQHQLHERLRRRLRLLRVLPPAQAQRRLRAVSFEQIGAKIDECKAIGGVQILMQGGHNPVHPVRVVSRPACATSSATTRSTSTASARAKSTSSPSVPHGRARRHSRAARRPGSTRIPGGGGEILVQRVRDLVAKKKAAADRWLGIMEIAHQEGMKTSVTMMYGIGETLAERIEHLERVREVQARTGGFTAFICWPLQPENTPRCRTMQKTDAVTTSARVAIARIVLDNVPNLQSCWVTMGHEGRPDRAALRLQRLRQPHDRGERRVGRQHDVPDDAAGDRAPHPRRRLHPMRRRQDYSVIEEPVAA